MDWFDPDRFNLRTLVRPRQTVRSYNRLWGEYQGYSLAEPFIYRPHGISSLKTPMFLKFSSQSFNLKKNRLLPILFYFLWETSTALFRYQPMSSSMEQKSFLLDMLYLPASERNTLMCTTQSFNLNENLINSNEWNACFNRLTLNLWRKVLTCRTHNEDPHNDL